MQPTMFSLSSICLSWQKVYDWDTHKCIQQCLLDAFMCVPMIGLKGSISVEKRCMMWSRCFRHSQCLSRQACLSHCYSNFQRVALNKGGDTVYVYRLIQFYTFFQIINNPLMFQVPKTSTRRCEALWSPDAIVFCVCFSLHVYSTSW